VHVPGWHEATKDLQAEGRIRMVGIVQEQHPDRARLFMQWKEMDWPVMVDAQNELGVAVVPITLFIDEHGIIRGRPPRRAMKAALEAFLDEPTVDVDRDDEAAVVRPDLGALEAGDVRAYAHGLVNWTDRFDDAVGAFDRASELEPDDGPTRFARGVAYRRRAESPSRRPGDFQRAVDDWSAALATDPNQYIWRRRIQQYGPRLMKPYPFYDWVPEAREAITARGNVPVPLRVEPSGAEYAHPSRDFEATDDTGGGADPEGRIHRDDGRFIHVETTIVPPTARPGATVRLHLVFRPSISTGAHWNNEAEPMRLWVLPAGGCAVDRREHVLPPGEGAVSDEPRRVELEVKISEDAEGTITIPAYALYNVCEGEDGACLYRRRDLTLEIGVQPRPEP
jgi:hypothetical protein